MGKRTVHAAVAETVGPEDIARASSPGTQMLLALAATGKHVYQGTVPKAVIERRRAANRRARLARRAGR